jgi:hypothetical protein
MSNQSRIQADPELPIPDSYWIRPGRLLAGEYPGGKKEAETIQRLDRFLQAGLTFFLDLTEAGEYNLAPYAPLLREQARACGKTVVYRRIPIQDMETPSPEEMMDILDLIDLALIAHHNVYIHCFGGIGRTGTVVGCYLVWHGLSGEAALRRLAELRRTTPKRGQPSPYTEAQRQMVRRFTRPAIVVPI